MIETYQSETEKKKAEIVELGTKPSVFQAQRCQACGLQLDLPTVHFLCKHSFHQRYGSLSSSIMTGWGVRLTVNGVDALTA